MSLAITSDSIRHIQMVVVEKITKKNILWAKQNNRIYEHSWTASAADL